MAHPQGRPMLVSSPVCLASSVRAAAQFFRSHRGAGGCWIGLNGLERVVYDCPVNGPVPVQAAPGNHQPDQRNREVKESARGNGTQAPSRRGDGRAAFGHSCWVILPRAVPRPGRERRRFRRLGPNRKPSYPYRGRPRGRNNRCSGRRRERFNPPVCSYSERDPIFSPQFSSAPGAGASDCAAHSAPAAITPAAITPAASSSSSSATAATAAPTAASQRAARHHS